MKTYSEYLAGIFPGMKVQKISVNAGMSCPNRDGTIGTGGCSYCRVDSFTPSYCMEEPGVAAQIERGKAFFARKYPEMRYLAYFQSFTNTHGRSLAALEALYREALACRDVVGLIVGTRPDTLPDDVVGLLSRLAASTGGTPGRRRRMPSRAALPPVSTAGCISSPVSPAKTMPW